MSPAKADLAAIVVREPLVAGVLLVNLEDKEPRSISGMLTISSVSSSWHRPTSGTVDSENAPKPGPSTVAAHGWTVVEAGAGAGAAFGVLPFVAAL